MLSEQDLTDRLQAWTTSAQPRVPSVISHPLPNSQIVSWLQSIEMGCLHWGIPDTQMSDAALSFMTGDLEIVVKMHKMLRISDENKYWPWAEFQAFMLSDELDRSFNSLYEEIKPQLVHNDESQWDSFRNQFNGRCHEISSSFDSFKREHPKIAASAGIGLVAAGSSVLLPAAGILALNAVGFTSAGVAAGSIAASVQSAVYGGLTCGLFSTLQSVGATATVASAGSIFTAASAVGTGVGMMFRGKKESRP